MCTCHARNPLHCIVPTYLLERLAASSDKNVRVAAIQSLIDSERVRGFRDVVNSIAPPLLKYAAASPGVPTRRREVYDQRNTNPPNSGLPGALRRAEGGPPTGDAAVDEAYDHSGTTWDFYNSIFGRNSLDDAGLTLVSSVHAGQRFNNAFWNGIQMVYGDGDGTVFQRFTRAIDVVAHELSHGVVQHTCGLIYQGESGALNEHFADVFGSMVRQFSLGQDASSADWLVGADILVPAPTRRALRSLSDPGTAFHSDPYLGDDPQPKHYSQRYTGGADNGGVHINSGIPNHAFYLACRDVGGNAWDRVGRVWYKMMLNLQPTSNFASAAAECRAVATAIFGASSPEFGAIDRAWSAVGL